jgi:hypothetical protein
MDWPRGSSLWGSVRIDFSTVIMWTPGQEHFTQGCALFKQSVSLCAFSLVQKHTFKGSDQRDLSGVGKSTNVEKCPGTVVLDICLPINFAAILQETYFYFRALQPNY